MSDKPIVRVVTAEIERGGRYLIAQRPPHAVLPLLWEFPGGKVEPGDPNDASALRRELRERFSLEGQVGALRQEIQHEYDRYTLALKVYQVTLDGEPGDMGRAHDHCWVAPEEFGDFQFPGADQQTVDALLEG